MFFIVFDPKDNRTDSAPSGNRECSSNSMFSTLDAYTVVDCNVGFTFSGVHDQGVHRFTGRGIQLDMRGKGGASKSYKSGIANRRKKTLLVSNDRRGDVR